MATRQFLEKCLWEAGRDGDCTIQGLFSSNLQFLCGYIDVKNKWNKKLLGRLYFISFYVYMYNLFKVDKIIKTANYIYKICNC